MLWKRDLHLHPDRVNKLIALNTGLRCFFVVYSYRLLLVVGIKAITKII